MQFRFIKIEEISDVMGFVKQVFDHSLREAVKEPGMISFFEEYICAEHIKEQILRGDLNVWGSFDEEYLIGVCGMTKEGHITLFYVHPHNWNQGVGQQMLCFMKNYAREYYHLPTISINVMPADRADYFIRNGFYLLDNNGNQSFVPLQARTGNEVFVQPSNISEKVIAGTAVGFTAVSVLVAVLYMVSYLFSL